jgi:hypothetical protein
LLACWAAITAKRRCSASAPPYYSLLSYDSTALVISICAPYLLLHLHFEASKMQRRQTDFRKRLSGFEIDALITRTAPRAM